MADFKTESQKFLSRSGWTLAARGAARVKLRQNGIVFFDQNWPFFRPAAALISAF
jgi:hypothetical protein